MASRWAQWSRARCPASMLVAILLTLLRGATSQAIQTYRSGWLAGTLTSLQLSGVQRRHTDPTYYLSTQSGVIYRVLFCTSVSQSNLPMRIPVTVEYDKIIDGVIHSCSIPMLSPPPPAAVAQPQPEQQQQQQQQQRRRGLLGEAITTPRSVKILVYVASFCGFSQPAAVTPQRVTNLLATGSGTYLGRSLVGYFKTCSYGQVTLEPGNVQVLGPVEVPCAGALQAPQPFASGPNFTTAACDEADNMAKWHLWLDEWAHRTHGVTAGAYHHRVLILPRLFSLQVKGCGGFSGAATPGRWPAAAAAAAAGNGWGSSLIWWSGDNFGDVEVLFHELGHTYGMGHANVPGGCDMYDQCDHTCTMGARGGQGIRCLNAPHNWQIGWGRPFLQLDNTSLQYGIPVSVRIPPQLSAMASSVLLSGADLLAPPPSPSAQPPPPPPPPPPSPPQPLPQRLFISTRINVYPYELPWPPWDDDKPFIVMHAYSGTDARPDLPTVWLGEIRLGETWRDANSSIVVRFEAWSSASGAVARICRRRADAEMSCGDGADDDCDFLTDEQDPDCGGQEVVELRDSAAAEATPKPTQPPARSSPMPVPAPPRALLPKGSPSPPTPPAPSPPPTPRPPPTPPPSTPPPPPPPRSPQPSRPKPPRRPKPPPARSPTAPSGLQPRPRPPPPPSPSPPSPSPPPPPPPRPRPPPPPSRPAPPSPPPPPVPPPPRAPPVPPSQPPSPRKRPKPPSPRPIRRPPPPPMSPRLPVSAPPPALRPSSRRRRLLVASSPSGAPRSRAQHRR